MDEWSFYWDHLFEEDDKTDDSYNYKEEYEKEKYYQQKYNSDE